MKTALIGKMASTVLATTVLTGTAFAADINIATGGEGGTYERMGALVQKNIETQSSRFDVQPNINVLNTNGSVENIQMMNDGSAQIIITQMDALNVMPPRGPYRVKRAYNETAFWIYNEANDYNDLEDIEGKKDVSLVIVDGSGAEVTMRSFVMEDDGYKVNLDNAVFADSVYDAADIVSEGKYNGKTIAGMIYVGAKIPSEIAYDFTNLRVGEMTDSDFNDATGSDGEPLYTSCSIKQSQTSGMRTSTFGSPDTVCVSSAVVYSTDSDYKETSTRDFENAIKRGINKSVRGM